MNIDKHLHEHMHVHVQMHMNIRIEYLNIFVIVAKTD